MMIDVLTAMTGLMTCSKVSAYHKKLAVQWQKKKESKAKSSSVSFSGFSPSAMPVPLSEFSTSFDISLIATIATSTDRIKLAVCVF